MAASFILSINRLSKNKEVEMEPETFRQWLSERGCAFVAGKDTVRTHVIVHRGDRRAVLPGVGTKKQLDPRIVRQIVDELGLDWNELPGRTSRG